MPSDGVAWSEFGTTEEEPTSATSGPEIREPFFEFLLQMVAADSVGQWDGAVLREHAEVAGRESRFPLDELVSLSRLRPDSTEVLLQPGATVRAVWRIKLLAAQDRAMPYSILGYHPGSLRIAAELVLSELAPQTVNFRVTGEDGAESQSVSDIRIFAMTTGYVVLDADGWLDALLGSALDDAWTVGFVVGRHEGRLLGLGVSVGRKGRPIYGEFDFANDEVLPHGRPLASALSRFSRTWLAVDGGVLPTPWQEP